MSLSLSNLDSITRQFMIEEIEQDIASGKLYISPRLNSKGRDMYAEMLKEAAASFDDGWLANKIRSEGLLNSQEERRKPKGGFTTVAVPITAPETLAEGEVNRFYARGLCRRAINEEHPSLEVYRAKSVMQARSESEAKIGTKINAEALLADLRAHLGVDTALGLPAGPNSGLSVKLPWA